MTHDAVRHGVENSQGDEAIKQETLRILDEAKRIRSNLDNDEAQQEYDDLRHATIAALSDLRASTHDELEAVRAGIWDGTVDVYAYAEWSITQEEFSNISREFGELRGMDTWTESSEDLSFFGSSMLWYIQETNDSILSGWNEALNSEIRWYITAFWWENGTTAMGDGLRHASANAAYVWASATLSSATMESSVNKLESIKNSGESLETKLFQLSQLLYEVGIEAWAPWELETAHNIATRGIISRVIESESWNFAVGYTNARWYYTVDKPVGLDNELEVGTYLCSLNKSGDLNKENLLAPNGPFSSTQLFIILERYKNGDFWGEDVRGLFGPYLEDFDTNMQALIADTVNTSREPSDISAIIQSGLTGSNPETVSAVLSDCELCSRIDEYTLEDIRVMSPEELRAYESNENTKAFHEGLIKKLEFHEQTEERIRSTLRDMLQELLGQETIPVGLDTQLEETTQETFIFMDAYLTQNSGSICTIDLIRLLQSDESPLQDLVEYVRIQQGISIDLSLIDQTVDTLTNLGLENQISQLNTEISVLQNEIRRLESIPENERSDEQISIIARFHDQISDTEILRDTAQTALDREIEAAEIRGMNEEQVESLKMYIQEYWLSANEAMEVIEWEHFDFSNTKLVEFFQHYPEHIWQIRNVETLEAFLAANEWNDVGISIRHIHPHLRGEFSIIRQVENLTISDINYIPDSYFNIDNESDAYSHLVVLLRNSEQHISRLALTKFVANTSAWNHPLLIAWIARILSSQEDHQIEQGKLDDLLANIPRGLIALDHQNTLGLEWNLWVEGNETQDRERFEVVFQRVQTSYSTNQEDRDTIHEYFSEYGVHEKSQAFIRLLQQRKIEGRTLTDTFPYLTQDNTTFQSIIEAGIETYGVVITELLPDVWRSNPRVIELTLRSCFTQHDSPNVEPQFRAHMRLTQSRNLETASNLLEINDAEDLLAAYRGLGEDTNLLKEHFWHKFNGETQLHAILNDATERYTSRFSYRNIATIRTIVEEIGEKQEQENAFREDFAEMKNTYVELNEVEQGQYMIRINEILDNNETISWNETQKNALRRHLEIFMENGWWVTIERRIYNTLVEIFWEGSPEITSLIQEFKDIRIERNTQALAESANAMLETTGSYPQRYQDVILSRVESGSEVSALYESIYQQYITEASAEDIANIDGFREEFIQNFLEEHGFIGEGFEAQRIQVREQIQAMFITIDDRLDRNNMDDYLWALAWDENAWRNYRRQRFENYSENMPETGFENETIPVPVMPNLGSFPEETANKYSETISQLQLSPSEAETLTVAELETLSNSEQARENFVNFRERLNDLNLDGIWRFRHGIFAAIGSLDFRVNDGNYIGENELNIFLARVMYATTGDEKYRGVPTNYGEIRDKIYIDNKLWPISGQEDTTSIWDGGWIIETEFRRLFAPRDAGVVEFRVWAFSQAIRGNRENLIA